jgi:hypothetical protein
MLLRHPIFSKFSAISYFRDKKTDICGRKELVAKHQAELEAKRTK